MALAAAVDVARRLWIKASRDDIFFLAGGIAFSLLLAAVPFVLLLASGLGFVLNESPEASFGAATSLIENLVPAAASGSLIDPVLQDVVRTRGTVGAVSAIAFLWFSTRLFGSMRSVLVRVFEEPRGRGIFVGKLLDVGLTLLVTVLIVMWIALSTYIALARSSGVELLSAIGLHAESVMRPLTYLVGRVVTFALLAMLFAALYHVLPNRRARRAQALLGGVVGAVLFEVARVAFGAVVGRYNPVTLYTGTLATVVVVVFWVYYAALAFILAAEFSHVMEERHVAATATA